MGIARRVRITGRVQGVFFRAWTKAQADDLGVTGWVRNCPDGSVEALISGDAAAVAAMIERMRRGPPDAAVEGLTEEPDDRCVDEEFVVRH
jgi:acylphosphatase